MEPSAGFTAKGLNRHPALIVPSWFHAQACKDLGQAYCRSGPARAVPGRGTVETGHGPHVTRTRHSTHEAKHTQPPKTEGPTEAAGNT